MGELGMEEPFVSVGTDDDGLRRATVAHRGCDIVIRFADEGDVLGEGLIHSVEIRPTLVGDRSKGFRPKDALEPAVVRQFIPQFARYLAYAQAAMRLLRDPDLPDEKKDEKDWQRYRSAAEPLRQLGGPGRRLPPEFFRRIAEDYRELVADGVPYPIKTISERHHVTISAASRWVTEARRQGHLEPKERS